MKYLIAGRNGQLARAFMATLERKGIDFIAPDEEKFDITNEAVVAEVVANCKPDVIINCAAYNLVDRAEQEQDTASRVNAVGPQYLALHASKHNAIVVHFGSDYVFDGQKEHGLYTEADEPNPINQYGKSKLAGEQAVHKHCRDTLIFRLSWVYGDGKQNFIYKLMDLAKKQEFLRIACDEFSVPTSASVVADITLRSLDAGLRGLWNLTNTGFCSRYEWATVVSRSLGIKKFIRPVSMDSFPLPAKRPKFSAMANQLLSNELNVCIPSWESSVETFLRERVRHE
jgi:dTDP-4-dehydrorhamnose reductase